MSSHSIPLYYVKVEKLPLNLIGKIDKTKLTELFENYLKIKKSKNINENVLIEKDEIVKNLINLWNEILPVPCYQNDINLNFFNVGGNSLLLFLLNSKLLKIFPASLFLAKNLPFF